MLLVGEGLVQFSKIFLAIVLVRLITQEAFGTYRQALLVFTLLLGLGSLNLASSLFYFIPKLGADRRLQITAQTFGLSLTTSLAVALVMWVGAEPIARFFNNPELARLVRILSPYALSEGILALVPSFMISVDRAVRAATYGMVASLLHVTVVLGLAYAGYDLSVIVASMVVVSVAVALVGTLDMLALCPRAPIRVDAELLRQQLGYCVPLWLTAVVGIINLQFDKILISRFFDPATYAIYAVGAIEIPLVALVTASLSNAIMPNLVSACQAGNRREALFTWHEAGRKGSFVIFPTFAFLLATAPDLVSLLYGEDYARAVWPFAIYLGLLPLRVFVYSVMLRALADTRPIAIAALLGTFLNIVVSTVLVVGGEGSLIAFVGPSIGTLVSAYSMGLFLLARIASQMDLPFRQVLRWRELGGVLLPSLLVAGVVFALPLAALPPGLRLLVQATSFAGVLLTWLWLAGILNEDEKAIVRKALNRRT